MAVSEGRTNSEGNKISTTSNTVLMLWQGLGEARMQVQQ